MRRAQTSGPAADGLLIRGLLVRVQSGEPRTNAGLTREDILDRLALFSVLHPPCILRNLPIVVGLCEPMSGVRRDPATRIRRNAPLAGSRRHSCEWGSRCTDRAVPRDAERRGEPGTAVRVTNSSALLRPLDNTAALARDRPLEDIMGRDGSGLVG